MAIIVNDSMSTEAAQRALHRESVNREGILAALQENRYYIKPSQRRHDKEKLRAKTKRRRAAAHRKDRHRGKLVE